VDRVDETGGLGDVGFLLRYAIEVGTCDVPLLKLESMLGGMSTEGTNRHKSNSQSEHLCVVDSHSLHVTASEESCLVLDDPPFGVTLDEKDPLDRDGAATLWQ
jgi:hypothetical protein